MEKYYIGLDIGTNSIGWAVTDEDYNIPKRKGKRMWGIRLFEDANTAAERRTFRAARRRLARRKQRIDLLQELFADEMQKIDSTFFIRLNESRLHVEDKSVDCKFPLFIDENYTDREYYDEFPTIFHLRKELITSTEPHDIRLVYLALHHILKNRGHFLINGEFKNTRNFSTVAEQFKTVIYDTFDLEIKSDKLKEFEETLRDKTFNASTKAKKLLAFFELDSEVLSKEDLKERKTIAETICKLMVGNTGDLKKIFGDACEGLDKSSFSFGDISYDDTIRPDIQDKMPDYSHVIDSIKAIYDWNILVDILSGEEYISFAKVSQYNIHKENSKDLHKLFKKYLPKEECHKFFDDSSSKDNYAAYIGSVKTRSKKISVNKCGEEDFYKGLKKLLEKIIPEAEDKELHQKLLEGAEQKDLLPLQRSKDNGVVPNQIHKAELKRILENAENYLPFLKVKDNNGITISDKILSIFSFRIPYYVGPLSDKHKNQGANVWIVRKNGKEKDKIYPWNFDDIVDKEKSNEAFIGRMTNKCTYLVGEDVLPKNSLLYSKYMVLNELNSLRIRGNKISVELKQRMYNDLFSTSIKVKGEKLLKYLQIEDSSLTKEDLSGFDIDFKASLSSQLDFQKKIFGDDITKDSIREIAENIIRWKTIYGDDQQMTENVILKNYPHILTNEQLKAVRRLRYSGWGNFSKKFLSGIEGTNKNTGEIYTIIQALWETNYNLQQLLSSDFTFSEEIAKINSAKQGEIKEFSYDTLVKDMIVSPGIKRAIWQSVQIIEEINKVMGHEPNKIFVEMARENEKRDENGKGKRKASRKSILLDLYKACEYDVKEWIEEIEKRDEREFNSTKLYLYYTQMGRCMYSGEHIDIDLLMAGNSKWDRDHIYPQSKVKDDSLDNLVLVNREFNAKKSNDMLSPEISKKQKGWWQQLLKCGFISKKKYDRLTRTTDFTKDELAGFINRQLVETRQSSKAVVELLGRLFPDSRIVQVKAGLTSQFRHKDLNVLKSRRVNDYHHAKDAYLNIVAGNVYDAKFTSNPKVWLAKNKDNTYNISRIFDFDVYRGNKKVWEGPAYNGKGRNQDGEKYGGTIDRIRATVKRNDILYTEYTYCDKGALFNATIMNKDKCAPIQLKKGMETSKYGGYHSANTSYFALIEFDGKKGERVRNIMEVPIYIANMLDHDPDAYLKYYTEVKQLKNVNILRPCIKKNSLIIVDGYPMRIRGTNDKIITWKNGVQPVFNKYENLIRNIEKYLDKNQEFEASEKFDKISNEDLLELYDDITERLLTTFSKRPANQGANLKSYRDNLYNLSLRKKALLINNILNFVRCDIETKADLTDIGGSKLAGNMALNKNTIGKSKLILVNQSITGIYENRIKL